jgi:hypothetical protein
MKAVRAGLAIAVCGIAFGTATAAAAPSEQGSDHANVHATLIDVEVFDAAKGGAKPPAGANCSNDGATDAANVAYTGWTTAGGVAHLNLATVPASVPNATASLQSAFNAWSNAGAPAFTVVNDGNVTRQTANRRTDLMFGRTQGSALAVTYTWRWTDGTIESDTIFNASFSWRDLGVEGDGCYETQPYYDLQNIATHEFGHIQGLDHPSAARFETMYAYGYSGETLKRSPGLGDLAAIAALY